MAEAGNSQDWGLYARTAAVSFAAAFGVSGGTHLAMMLLGHPLIKKHKATLQFRSAWLGDGVILPVVNCLIIKSLRQWKPRLAGGAGLTATGGTATSLLFHIVQANGGLVNWTMTRPWRWNWLGYYHFVYMSTQFSYFVLYLQQLAGHWSKGQVTPEQKRELAIIAAMMVGFGVVLATDY